MKWKILKLETLKSDIRWGCFYCENENGEREWLDLFTDSSYKGFGKITRAGKNWEEKYKTLIGKEIEIEEIFPYKPLYFAKNIILTPSKEEQSLNNENKGEDITEEKEIENE